MLRPPLFVRPFVGFLLAAAALTAGAGCAGSDQSTHPQPSRLEQARAYSAEKTGDPLTDPIQASPGYGAGVWLNVPLDSIPPAQFERFWSHVPESILLTHDEKRLIYDGASSEMFMAAGRYNQRLYVLPSRRMVVVRLGRADRTWSDVAFLARLLGGEPRREQSR